MKKLSLYFPDRLLKLYRSHRQNYVMYAALRGGDTTDYVTDDEPNTGSGIVPDDAAYSSRRE